LCSVPRSKKLELFVMSDGLEDENNPKSLAELLD
jgi:hypothetical protein